MARCSQVWLNGKLIPLEDAKISLFTHSLHYGIGVFEGIRAYHQKKGGGAIFRLQEHLNRLHESCRIVNLPLSYSVEELTQACLSTCKANGFEECYLRPLVFISDGPLGIDPGASPPLEVAILTWEWGKYLGASAATNGIRLKISSYIRPHVNSSFTKGKITGQYVNSVMAKREAVAAGYDEALLLDKDGYLTEGTGENLFMVKNGVIKTPPLTSILNGITRQTVMEYFADQGHPVIESRFSRDELWCADEVFLTGTAAEITPVASIDHCTIGTGPQAGKPGIFTQKLIQAYDNMTRGNLPRYEKWLTPIR